MSQVPVLLLPKVSNKRDKDAVQRESIVLVGALNRIFALDILNKRLAPQLDTNKEANKNNG